LPSALAVTAGADQYNEKALLKALEKEVTEARW
jgi:hypothetical protein